MSAPLRTLIVEDAEDDARLLINALKKGGYDVAWERVETGEALTAALARQEWDLVIADFNLPRFSGTSALAMLQQTGLDIPLILVSGSVSEEMAVDAMLAGARDFIVKERPSRLVPAVQRELAAAVLRRQRRTLEKQLHEEQERFRALVEKSAEVLLVIDRQGRIDYESPSAERIFGYTRAERVGRHAFENVHPEDAPALQADFTALLEQPGGARRREFRYRHKDGNWRWLEGIATNLLHDPSVQGFVANIRDITGRKALETQFLHAQRMDAFGQLAGGVAHDFNNILTAVLIQLDLLRMRDDLPADVMEAHLELNQAAQRASSLTRQLLLFSRRQPIQKHRLELDDLLANLIKMLRRLLGEQIELSLEPAREALWINGDSGMIEQVVVNLCVNARDAMPRGGRLTIAARALERPATPPAGVVADGPYVCLSVSDTGCGMDAATLKRIFEPFFTTKEVGKGTGLGLATVYGIVKEHRGWIEVESAPGAGSTFRVYLPRETAQASAVASTTETPGGHECVLLVEDELAVRELVTRSLRRAGYQVLDTSHAAGARAHWAISGENIDLLFTDMVMPGGTTGLELAEELRQRRPALRVIVTTGHSDHASQLAAKLGGPIRFLPKPFEATLLLQTVREALDQPLPR